MIKKAAITVIEELDTLLDRERAALIAGHLDEIPRIGARKEDLVSALGSITPVERGKLSRIQEKIIRNQTLLDGTLQGIRRVAARIVSLRDGCKDIETYDASGQKRPLQRHVPHRVERRA